MNCLEELTLRIDYHHMYSDHLRLSQNSKIEDRREILILQSAIQYVYYYVYEKSKVIMLLLKSILSDKEYKTNTGHKNFNIMFCT